MFEVRGASYRSCDGLSRRGFLRVGSLGLLGLTLPEVLRARALGSTAAPARSVIQIIMGGGPSQLETYDPKPEANSKIRSECRSIATSIPGVFLAETMPRHARALDRMAILRGLSHESSDHTIGLHRIMTGYPTIQPRDRNERPNTGSIVARVQGANKPGVPPYVAMAGRSAFDGLFNDGAYLGANFRPFELDADPDATVSTSARLSPAPGLDSGRIRDRQALLQGLDRLSRDRDASGSMEGMDRFTAQAFDLIAGPVARRALDFALEPAEVQDRYGRTRIGRSCLLARRLVEAGVTFVTITEGDWDHHARVAESCGRQVPPMDAALATLVEDLSDRGLSDSVLVVAWGEFGRTPRLNGAGGRNHWPSSMSAMLAGGGLKMGQVVGGSDANGERSVDRPWRPEDVIRTIYHVLGIDPRREFSDEFGRPYPILDRGRLIPPTYLKHGDIPLNRFRLLAFSTLLAVTSLIVPSSHAIAQSGDSKAEGWISLFNGKDLEGWTVKIRGHEPGDNFANTFRVEDGLIKVRYDGYDKFAERFGHLYTNKAYSNYRLRVEYRFTGPQCPGGPGWATRNSGAMIHSQSPESMSKDQDFPVSIEVQYLGGDGRVPRHTSNVCTPGTNIVRNGKLITQHCTESSSKTFPLETWVTAEVEVHGDGVIKHIVDGETVLEYEKPQFDDRDANAKRLIKDGMLLIHEGRIALQSESHPIEFRKVELLPLAP